jgi:hypothetical protein
MDRDKAGSDLLVGRVWTELSLRLDSNRKKPRRLAGTRVALAPMVGDVGDTADIGRLRSESSPLRGLLVNMSKTAPAVLGRPSSSTVLSDGRPTRDGCGLELLPPTMEERLLVAEWPRNVDRLVSVSEEMVESGRMYSTLSENPTRALDGGRAADSSSEPLSRSDGCDTDLLKEWPKANSLPSDGVAGALPPRAGAAGFIMEDRSCEDMAPERR